jgi:glycosyltransferase involved in cell wall biosynthesis
LPRTLDALAAQTAAPESFEVVVVVDGPSQPLEAFLRNAATPFALRWLVQPRQGETSARNLALRHARGAVVISTDDDTIPVPTWVERHASWHKQTTRYVVAGNVRNHPESPEMFLAETVAWTNGWAEWVERTASSATHGHISDSNFSIRREHLIGVGGWESALQGYGGFDDVELGYRLQRAGLKMEIDLEAITFHRYTKKLPALLQHMRARGRAEIFFYEKYPERIEDIALPGLLGSSLHRSLFYLASLVPERSFAAFAARVAPRIETRNWPKNALTRSFVRLLTGVYLCRGYWDHPAIRKAIQAAK